MQRATLPTFRSSATILLDDFLLMNPGVAFAGWHDGRGRAGVDLLRVPAHERRRGIGRTAYRLWEAGLPTDTLVAVDPADQDARLFWRALGFAGSNGGVMTRTTALTRATAVLASSAPIPAHEDLRCCLRSAA